MWRLLAFTCFDNGRARTFKQSNLLGVVNSAISVCPVSCMHKVALHELEIMETARDVLNRILSPREISCL